MDALQELLSVAGSSANSSYLDEAKPKWLWTEIGRLDMTDQGHVRIVLRDDRQHGVVVDVRYWRRGQGATKAGVLIPVDQLPALIHMLQITENVARGSGVLADDVM